MYDDILKVGSGQKNWILLSEPLGVDNTAGPNSLAERDCGTYRISGR